MSWTELVKTRIKELDITQEKLAELVDVTPGGMGHWLNKRREPSLEQIAKILQVLRIDQVMLNSDGTLEYPKEYSQPTYPRLTATQAGEYSDSVSLSESCFWMEVQGDSMTTASGVSFPEHTLILIDTKKEVQIGSLVVAKLENVREATFKKLVKDAGQEFLKPLNTAYPLIAVDQSCQIIGIVVDVQFNLT